MAEVVLLTVAGLHVPVILLVDVVGSTGAAAPEQIGAIALNAGMIFRLTVMFKVVVVAHCPASGVNVYVADVVLSTVAGLHVPVILFVDIVGKVGAAAPEQIAAIASNAGIMVVLTVMLNVVVVAH